MALRGPRPVHPGAQALNRLAAAIARYNCKCGKWIVLPPSVNDENKPIVCECGEKHYWTPYPEHLCKQGRERIAELEEALTEIAKGEGAFSRDPLEHAANTVDHMKELAKAVLPAEPAEEPSADNL